MSYRTADVEVRGGALRVGIWESADLSPDARAESTVLAVHGVTASHVAWALTAERVVSGARTRFVAPDLRGRGRSADLPGPWGMDTHADDLQAVTTWLGVPDVTAGHSMGGFVAVVAAHRHRATFGELVLVDGGVPLPRPDGVPIEAVVQAVLGPAAQRLSMTFTDHDAYREFWRKHPAFVGAWSAAVEDYVDYDLVLGPQGWHSAVTFDAVAQDSAELGDGGSVQAAWAGMNERPTFLRSPLGLLAEAPGLYPPAALERFAVEHPGFRWTDVENTNHYTLLMAAHGADCVSAVLIDRLIAAKEIAP